MGVTFESWGIVELMGHQRAAGRISEEEIGGSKLLRIDIPDGDTYRTVFYGSSAIYALHVTDEAAARAAAKRSGSQPTYAWELERYARSLPAPAHAAAVTAAQAGADDYDYGDDEPPV